MILKIERHNDLKDWLMFDNVSKILTSRVLYACDGEGIGPVADTVFAHSTGQNITILDHKDKLDNNNQYVFKGLRLFVGGVMQTVWFDTVAYICNDQGKTIERIIVNNK